MIEATYSQRGWRKIRSCNPLLSVGKERCAPRRGEEGEEEDDKGDERKRGRERRIAAAGVEDNCGSPGLKLPTVFSSPRWGL